MLSTTGVTGAERVLGGTNNSGCLQSPRSAALMQAASRDGTADRRPVVVVGSVNADLVLRVPRLPRPGETLNAADLRFFPGGKASLRRSLLLPAGQASAAATNSLARTENAPNLANLRVMFCSDLLHHHALILAGCEHCCCSSEAGPPHALYRCRGR
jgi:hypothetical protein